MNPEIIFQPTSHLRREKQVEDCYTYRYNCNSITYIVLHTRVMKTNSKCISSQKEHKIIFLHHSVGSVIFNAGNRTNRIIRKLFPQKSYISQWFENYNCINGTNYHITEQFFPRKELYGWNNYPYDYYNIWVKNAGYQPYLSEPTLEILTKQYKLIIFKHCYPISDMKEDLNLPDINSPEKSIKNYHLQYIALKKKLNEFPNTKFLIWTGAAQVESNTTKEKALRAKEFFNWVKNDWNIEEGNIFLWDFFDLETEGGLFLKNENANTTNDSHPGKSFAKKVAPLFCKRIIEVIQHNTGLST